MRRLTSSLGSARGLLGAHEAEHDGRALGRKAQRGEIAGALVVIFEEEAVDLHLVEQDLCDRLVAALRHPGALEIAAAQMDAHGHIGRPIADRIVDQPAIEADERVRVVAARLGSRANVRDRRDKQDWCRRIAGSASRAPQDRRSRRDRRRSDRRRNSQGADRPPR